MSIAQIARKTGLSVGTISNYFNAPEKVNPETAARIRSVVEEFEYRPRLRRPGPKNGIRVGLKSGNIVFLSMYSASLGHLLQNPGTSTLISEIQRLLNELKLSLTFAVLGANGELPECVDQRFCDGVVIYGRPERPAFNRKLKNQLRDLPAVCCCRDSSEIQNCYTHISYDNRKIGAIAAEYLREHHHRHVAVIEGGSWHLAFAERSAGFRERAGELGLKLSVIVPGENTAFPGRELLDSCRMPENCGATGLFFCNEEKLLQFYIALHDEERLPGRFELICGSGGNDAFPRYFERRPTLVDPKLALVAKLTVEQLLERINHAADYRRSEIMITPELIPGE